MTAELVGTLKTPEILRAFWASVAPKRFASQTPTFTAFGRLGKAKPDLLFRCRNTPALYIEAKLDCQTEPLQLTRARSWMRAVVADHEESRDDEVLLIQQYEDVLPMAIGWTGKVLPVRSMSWHELERRLRVKCLAVSNPEAKSKLRHFSDKLRECSAGSMKKTKQGLLFQSKHCYGAMMSRVAQEWCIAEFLYGARHDPRLCLGRSKWRAAFGTPDIERLRLHYGPDRNDLESYRGELLLWHTHDLAHSADQLRRHWVLWRKQIEADER